jgi:LacI family transcriptional regulator
LEGEPWRHSQLTSRKPTKTPIKTSRSTQPTIRDVAEAAGVSYGTVSKSLNGTGQLRAETRALVRSTAERLGFRPNSLAQSLLRRRSFTVGLISTDRYGRFSIPVLEGIEDALGSASISVFLCSAADDPEREHQHVESLLAKRVDGIIVTARRADPRPPLHFARGGPPVLYAFARVNDPKALCVLPDDFGGGKLAGDHLVGVGRMRIAHITGPKGFEAVAHRRDGLRRAMEQRGLPWRADWVMYGEWSEAWGREAVARLIASNRKVDAMFCGSDQIARGAVDALRDRGIRVPDDIAVVGFDNWEIIAAATRPPLTTVDMNLYELGRQAGLRLLDRIEGNDGEGVVRLPCTLVVRDSCGSAVAAGGTDAAPRRHGVVS